MESTFDNYSVLVTGGALRIGRAICLAFASRGARVIVHCHRSVASAKELVEELPKVGLPHRLVVGDLVDSAFRSRLIPDLVAAGICLDCLVNNASTYRRMPLRDARGGSLREDFEINFFAPFLLMRDFAEHCGKGCIVNLLDQRVASVESGAGGYALAKKALRDATEAAALEWAPAVRVNAVAPGYSLPPPGVAADKMLPLLENVPMHQSSPPEEVAQACLFLAQSPSLTGQTIFVDGGMHLTTPLRREREKANGGSPHSVEGQGQ